MPYTPDAENAAAPLDSEQASTAAAEFRTLKNYLLTKHPKTIAVSQATANAYTANLPGITALSTEQLYSFTNATAANTGPATLSISGGAPVSIKKVIDGVKTALAVGDIPTNAAFIAFYDGVDFILLNTNIPNTAGKISYFARNTAPVGYLKANGATISRTVYATLFAAIGTTFGVGDGTTTFGIPDLRGEFLRGWDDARGVDAGRAFGSAQAEETKSHAHTASETSAGAHTHTIPANTSGGSSGATFASSQDSLNPSSFQSTGSAGAHTHTITVNASGGTETRPRNIAMLACIKYT